MEEHIMESFNTTKKLSLTLIGLSYLSAAHAGGIFTIATNVIKGAIGVAMEAPGQAIKIAENTILIDG